MIFVTIYNNNSTLHTYCDLFYDLNQPTTTTQQTHKPSGKKNMYKIYLDFTTDSTVLRNCFTSSANVENVEFICHYI